MMDRACACVCLLPLLLAGRGAMAEQPPPPVMVGPSAARIAALEASGRRNKRIGAVLIGVGSGIAAVGTGLWAAGAWHDDGCYGHGYYDDGYYRGHAYYGGHAYRVYYDDCNRALSVAGATTMLLGIGTIVPGIILYIQGGSAVDAARRLRIERSQRWP